MASPCNCDLFLAAGLLSETQFIQSGKNMSRVRWVAALQRCRSRRGDTAMIREGTRAAKPICRRPRRPHAAGATGLMRSAARAKHAPDCAIAPPSGLAAGGQDSAPPWGGSRPWRLCAPRAGQAAWLPTPSPRRRPFRPANRQGQHVGHGQVRLGSRLAPFSRQQGRQACTEATSPLPQQSHGQRRPQEDERLDA